VGRDGLLHDIQHHWRRVRCCCRNSYCRL
jgi:hypothetical protein